MIFPDWLGTYGSGTGTGEIIYMQTYEAKHKADFKVDTVKLFFNTTTPSVQFKSDVVKATFSAAPTVFKFKSLYYVNGVLGGQV
jgi:hypothetical protein